MNLTHHPVGQIKWLAQKLEGDGATRCEDVKFHTFSCVFIKPMSPLC